jgi:hypothetical protein
VELKSDDLEEDPGRQSGNILRLSGGLVAGAPFLVGGPVGPTVNAGSTGVWIQDVSAGVALRF